MKEKEEIYLEERRMLVQAEQDAYQQFDKTIITIASGGLGLSLLFLKDILDKDQITSQWLLIVSWCSFILSILSTLLSFMGSQRAFRRQIEITDELYSKNQTHDSNNKPAKATEKLNYFSIGFLILAIILLVIFVSLNFQ